MYELDVLHLAHLANVKYKRVDVVFFAVLEVLYAADTHCRQSEVAKCKGLELALDDIKCRHLLLVFVSLQDGGGAKRICLGLCRLCVFHIAFRLLQPGAFEIAYFAVLGLVLHHVAVRCNIADIYIVFVIWHEESEVDGAVVGCQRLPLVRLLGDFQCL